MSAFREGLASGPLLYKIPGIGKVIEAVSEPLFTYYIPALKLKTYQAILKRNTHLYDKEVKSGKTSMDDVKYLSAQQANAAYGHQNYVDMGRNKTIQHLLRMTILAPDFLEARTRFAGQAMKTAIAPQKKAGVEQMAALATLATTFYVGARLLNKYFDDDYHFDEPFKLVIGNRKYGLRSVPEDMYMAYKNPHQFVSGRMSPIIGKSVQWFLTKKDYRGQPQSPMEFLQELASSASPISLRQWLPGKSGNKDIEPWQSFLTAMGLQISRYSKANEVFDLVGKWKEKHGVSDPGQVYPPSKFRDVRNALMDDDMERFQKEWKDLIEKENKKNPELTKKQQEGKLAVGLKMGLIRPFTGTKIKEAQFIQSLSKDQKEAYDRARSERITILKKFADYYKDKAADTTQSKEE
jgi:hypothetical protein